MELSLHCGCICWGDRVVIPPPLRRQVLQALHASHPGIARMKALARSYVWWPLMDAEIASWVAACGTCQASRPAPPTAAPREWDVPKSPWSRVHIDFAGPFHGQTFMVVVDAYSRWVEVILMSSTTAESTVKALRRLFATHGLPDTLVSDNGPQFHSSVFQEFLAALGIRHAPVAPYHPASNGRAERAVRSAKEALARLEGDDWPARVDAYLIGQHSTPCPLSGKSPAELLMGRRLRITLDRLHPDYNGVQQSNLGSPSPRNFRVGESIWARNFSGDPKWVPAKVIELTGPCSYRVGVANGAEWRRHLDQLRRRPPAPAELPDSRRSDQLDPVGSVQPAPVGLEQLASVEPLQKTLTTFPTTTTTTDLDNNIDLDYLTFLKKVSRDSQPSAAPPRPDSPFQQTPPPEVGQDDVARDSTPRREEPSQARPPQPTPPQELRRSGRRRQSPTYLQDYDCARVGGKEC